MKPNGKLCDMLEDRVAVGIDLYKNNKAKKLLFSGDHGQVNYDEVNGMKKVAEKKGVKKEDIFLDHAGFSTYEVCIEQKRFLKLKNNNCNSAIPSYEGCVYSKTAWIRCLWSKFRSKKLLGNR